MPFLDAVAKIINSYREFWPISLRKVHYDLLNDPPLTHASKPDSRYRTDDAKRTWTRKLSNLVTRARIEGLIPEDAIEDESRPITILDCYPEAGAFIEKELDGLLKGYSRDFQRPQPNHIELMVEKNTAGNFLKPVALEYGIPLTSGHGFCSLPPRIGMKNRFLASGKDKLVIIVVSDFDPDGEEIGHSFARLMRDDFDLNVTAIKAGLTLEQIKRLKLRSSHHAKKGSTNYKRFAAKYGADQDAYELETLKVADLQREVRTVINQVMDLEVFDAEVEQEKLDAVRILGLRKAILDMMNNTGVGQ